MGSVGSWWLKAVEAEPGEQVEWSRAANRAQGARAVGGKLFLTDRRIIFCPHLFDGLLGGQCWEAPLSDVAEFKTQGAGTGGGLFAGMMRTRLCVRLTDGSEELFVVSRLQEEVLPQLREALSRRERHA